MRPVILPVLMLVLPPLQAAPKRGQLPLLFISNHGQSAPENRFMVKGASVTALFRKDETIFEGHGGIAGVRFVGATGPTEVTGLERAATTANFLSGPEESWVVGAPVYRGVAYRAIYPGIDLEFSGEGRHLKSEFIVAPGADPRQIRLEYAGATTVKVEEDGSLSARFGRRVVREKAPYVYQERGGTEVPIDASFVASGNVVSFSIGVYDHTLPPVIDPVVYVTLLSGSGADAALSLAIDGTGAAYIAGFTSSFDLPTTGASQPISAGGNEVFVAKLNAQGNGLVYCTYIGGRGDDRAYGIAVDTTGAAYITGATTSTNFPLVKPIQAALGGSRTRSC